MADSKENKLKKLISKKKENQTKTEPKQEPETKNEEGSKVEPSSELIVDVKNEQLLLGLALNNEHLLSNLVANSSYEDFLVDNHKVIAWCLNEIYDQKLKPTEDVFDILRVKFPGKTKATGGYQYLHDLKTTFTEDCPSVTYTKHIWKLKTDSVKQRLANEYLTKLTKLIYNPAVELSEIVEENSHLENYLRSNMDSESKGFKSMSEINLLHDVEIERRNKPSSFTTSGFRWLDEYLTDGFSPGKITVCGGRPGMGKSAFVANSMVRLANHHKNPIANALFALEMNSISQIDRMNSIQTGIPLSKLIKDRHLLTEEEKTLEASIKKRRADRPIFICDDVRKSLPEVKRELKFLKEKHGVKVAFIDLFMKLKGMSNRKNQSTADQYTEMLNEVQRIAREVDVHIVLVVQIGRKVENRPDKRPTMSDLKDSGAYEEVADNILLFYRDAYYQQRDAHEALPWDVMEIIIGKQRQGMTGTVYAIFEGQTTRISKATDEELEIFEKNIELIKGKKRMAKNASRAAQRRD